tara:strand:- start:269 stop:592 length:324 start_codon:yes stop_codon:yes gene_type:complete
MLYIEEGTRETALSVSNWFMKEYLSDYHIFLTVEDRDLSEEGVDGWCIKETSNEFLIQIHNGLMYDYIPTLLHELYHVLQHLEGREQDEYEAYRKEVELLDKYMNKG